MSHRNFNFARLLNSGLFVAFVLAITSGFVLFSTPAQAEETTSSTPTDDEVAVQLTVRYQDQIVFIGPVNIPTTTEFVFQNGAETATGTTGVTALAALVNADISSDNFAINKIDYFSSMNSYLISCLRINDGTDACNNWQYTVSGTYPSLSADQQPIAVGDQIYFYFGDRHQIDISTTSIFIGETVTGTIKEYNYNTNEYSPLPTTVLGLLDTNDTAILTTTTDSNGDAIFTVATTGTFHIGMEVTSTWGAYYWPKSIDFTVIENFSPSSTTTTIDTADIQPGGNGGGGNYTPEYKFIDIDRALSFLSGQQINGYFSSNLLTDWSALAFASFDSNTTTALIKNYLISHTDSAGGLNSVSNDARRALALMALGVSPYSGTALNYIKKITDSFDGAQFGDASIYNDDIFALLALIKAGYTANEPIIQSDINFILSKQKSDGSFDGTDLTAAAVQALELADDVTGVDTAIMKAKEYLLTRQNTDGSFVGSDQVITTAWCAQALRENTDAFKRGNNYLFSKQAADGGLSGDKDIFSRVWATAFAIPAGQGKSWGMILKNFNQPIIVNDSQASTSTNTIQYPTSTIIVTGATTTTIAEPKTIDFTSSTDDIPQIIEDKEIKTTPSLIIKKMPTTTTNTPNTVGPIIESYNSQIAPPKTIIDKLPLDTPTRATAKKIMMISGGGTVALGLYLGLRLLRSVL
ncbi:MAG: prenyltransferase/squalene oxidase repeat-containing protein [Candidatus Magasanikbacteria bacterium]